MCGSPDLAPLKVGGVYADYYTGYRKCMDCGLLYNPELINELRAGLKTFTQTFTVKDEATDFPEGEDLTRLVNVVLGSKTSPGPEDGAKG